MVGQPLGNYVEVVHPGSPPFKSRYAHLDELAIDEGAVGEVVFTTTQIGTVGSTGTQDPHLHLSFWRWHEGNQRWQSFRNDPASRKPSPMWTAEGLTTLCDRSTMTVTKEASVFHDVDPTNPKSPYITSLYAHGYAIGCNNDPFEFCPWQKLTRAEMAVLIVRAHNGPDFEPDEPQQVLFVDVDLSAWYAPWVHQLYQDGYTAGCSTQPLRFCPDELVTKAELAVFIVRAIHRAEPGYQPPPAQGLFVDADPQVWWAKWAEEAYNAGIMSACGGVHSLRFCPDIAETRRQVAVYMVRGFDLPLPPEPEDPPFPP